MHSYSRKRLQEITASNESKEFNLDLTKNSLSVAMKKPSTAGGAFIGDP